MTRAGWEAVIGAASALAFFVAWVRTKGEALQWLGVGLLIVALVVVPKA